MAVPKDQESCIPDLSIRQLVFLVVYGSIVAAISRYTVPGRNKSDITAEYAKLKAGQFVDTSQSQVTCPPCPICASCPKAQLPEVQTQPCTDVTGGEPLSDILNRFGSDKSSHHGYDRYYDHLLGPLRNKNVKLVEIGVEKGKSLRTWQLYFGAKANIYGIGYGNFQVSKYEDCSDAKDTTVARANDGQICKIYKGDQSDVDFLDYFVNATGGDYDVLIDDGSHVPSHQLISFERLWPHIKPGGIYVIEDIETNYWRMEDRVNVYGYPFGNERSIMPHFKEVVETINREYQCGVHNLSSLYDNVQSIQFGQNLIILRKAKADDNKLSRQRYRLQPNVACRKRG